MLLLGASGLAKLLDLTGFLVVMATYQVFSSAMLPAAGAVLVIAEVGLAVWLAIWSPTGLKVDPMPTKNVAMWHAPVVALIVLHVVYFLWILVAYWRGLAIPNCGCFGVFWPRQLTGATLLEDAILIALAACLHRAAIINAQR